MPGQELWKRYCEYLVVNPALGISLDISRMDFTESFLENMETPMAMAFKAMQALEAGDLANPDEGRMVGHYWLRAPELAPDKEIRQAIEAAINNVESFVQEVHTGRLQPQRGGCFSELLVVGIGGSALGPQLVADALQTDQDKMNVHFIDNTDPDGIDLTLGRIGDRLEKTLVLVISKSGTTSETRNGMLEVQHAFQAAGLNFAKHAVAVTGTGSKLFAAAQAEEWLTTFPMWDWVGGRTSVMSPVGLLPAALQGIDIRLFLDGARAMDEQTRIPKLRINPAAILSTMWYFAGDGHGKKDMVILPYKDRLLLLSRYLQQLIMESLGKELNLDGLPVYQGIAVYGNKGSTDQHAYVQQLRDGVDNFFATFISILKDRAGEPFDVEPSITSGDYLAGFMLGTRKALSDRGRGSITITLQELNPKSLGGLIALYERTVGLYAHLIGINAYHQPGVEAGKKAARDVIELQKKLLTAIQDGRQGTAEDLAECTGARNEVETVFHILEHLSANGVILQRAGTTPFDKHYYA